MTTIGAEWVRMTLKLRLSHGLAARRPWAVAT